MKAELECWTFKNVLEEKSKVGRLEKKLFFKKKDDTNFPKYNLIGIEPGKLVFDFPNSNILISKFSLVLGLCKYLQIFNIIPQKLNFKV